MRNLKKILALVLALTMMLSVSAFAGYTIAPYGDAASVNEDAQVAVQLLYSLDIMKGDDKGNVNPTATITRAEVAKMIYVILNYGEDDQAVNFKSSSLFSDVKAGDWFEGYVNYCGMTKLVQGRGNGTFGPNDPITTAEVAKMLLTAIGYSAEDRAYVGAGWDKQVLADASMIGLLDGYNYSTTGYAPRQWVAVMFMNALTKARTYGTIAPVVFNGLLTGVNYPENTYPTMGWKYFNLYKWEGVITANEYADLYSAETLSSGRTNIDKGALKFKGWTTDLTEIGEYRWGYAVEAGTNDEVVYVGGADENTTFSTGNAVSKISTRSNVGGIRVNAATEYYKNFAESSSYNASENGQWLKLIDNDGNGYADYVFYTEFKMTEVTKVAKDDTVFLANGKKSDEYAMSADVATGDVVLYTKIDDVEYVEIAKTFTGEVDQYIYKTDILVVDNVEYGQSAVELDEYMKANYFDKIQSAKKDNEYTYYQDFFGFIRAYALPSGADKDIVLLTNAYYGVTKYGKEYAVNAYLNGELSYVDAKYNDDSSIFFDLAGSANNDWDRLNEFGKGTTNLARYTMSDEGVIALSTAKTFWYNNKHEAGPVKTDYIDLQEKDLSAGQKTLYGYNNVRIQANKETVYYYVSHTSTGKTVVETVTGYANSYDVVNKYVTIVDMYAVATNTEQDASKAPYWVADVVVIETADPVFNLSNNVVFGYDVINKTVYDYAALDVIGADGKLDTLNVTSYNGYDKFVRADVMEALPAFYFNTEDADGESHIREIEAGWNNLGIYAEKIDRVNDLFEYVVTTDAETYTYDENTVVYDLTKYTNYVGITTEDDYDDALVLETGASYILYTDGEGYIIYAILVESYNDFATDLFYDIGGAAVDTDGKIYGFYADLIDATDKSTAGTNEAWPVGAAAAAKKAVAEKLATMSAEDIAKLDPENNPYDQLIWMGVVVPAVEKARAEATAQDAVDALAKLIDGETFTLNHGADVDTQLITKLTAKTGTELEPSFDFATITYDFDALTGRVNDFKVVVKVGECTSTAYVNLVIYVGV